LEQMRANPAADWTAEDVRALCESYGLLFEAPRRGSHFTIRAGDGRGFLVVPSRRPIKAVYIRAVVKLVADMISGGDDGP
jgi:hypothetical protein